MAARKPFHNPFRGLKLELPQSRPATEPARAPQPETVPEDDRELFLRAVGDVQPLRQGGERVPPRAAPRPPRIVDDDEEVLFELAELVAGRAPFDIADSDEFIEGCVQDLDRRILKRLRNGDYSIQATLDLHGLTQVEAKEALLRFVERCRGEGKRCVLVIHGRGKNSENRIPVLKEGVQRWLTQGRLGRQVLAFCSARPKDGGVGAIYVLLRR